MHRTLTMSVSGSCKLHVVLIISPGIYKTFSMANCQSCRESPLWTISSGPIYLCGYPYQSTRSEVLTSVPTWFVYLRLCTTNPTKRLYDCQRLRSACKPTIFSLYEWLHEPYLGLPKSNKQRFRQLVWSLQADRSRRLSNTNFSCRLYTIQMDSTQYWRVYPNNKLKKLCWLIFLKTILGHLWHERVLSAACQTRLNTHVISKADFRHWFCWL